MCDYWDRQENWLVCLVMVTIVVPYMLCHTEESLQQGSREGACLFTFCSLGGI